MKRRLSLWVMLALAAMPAASICYSATALDVVTTLATRCHACVSSLPDEAALRAVAVASPAADQEALIGQLDQAGLTVFSARDQNVLVVADMRPTETPPPSDDRLVLGSRLMAMIPASAVAEQATARKEKKAPLFGLAQLPPQARELVAALSKQDLVSDPTMFGQLRWNIEPFLRDDTADPATMARAPFPNRYFYEAPIACAANRPMPAREILWAAWPFSNSVWTRAACPAVPNGKTTVQAMADAIAAEQRVSLHPSLTMIGDTAVHVWGQPSSLGGLLWALQITTGMRCRPTPEHPDRLELYHTLKVPFDLPDKLLSLPLLGYVSPLRVPAVQANLALSDYGSLIPLHDWRPLQDLPPLYLWGMAPGRGEARGLSVLWLRQASLWITQPGLNGKTSLMLDLPLL